MFHTHPLSSAVDTVWLAVPAGSGGVGNTTAASLNRLSANERNGSPSACCTSNERKPLQSTNTSPAMRRPSSISTAATLPLSPRSIATNLPRSKEHTSELQSLMRISYAVFCLKKHNNQLKIAIQNN